MAEESKTPEVLTISEAFRKASKYHQAGNLVEAERLYRRILEKQPKNIDVLTNLGVLCKNRGHIDEAIDFYKRALGVDREYVPALNNIGNAFVQIGSLDEAVDAFCKALSVYPDYSEGWNNLGLALHDLGRYGEALRAYDRALALSSDPAEIYSNRGNSLIAQGRIRCALVNLQKSLSLKPAAKTYNNVGVAYKWLNKQVEAEWAFRKSLEIDPDFAEAHQNLAFTLLSLGRFAEGMEEYEWGFRVPRGKGRGRLWELPHRRWEGESLQGKKIFVYGEQGIGDEIMFASLLPELLRAGAEVGVACTARLVPLFKRSFPQIKVVDRSPDLVSQFLHVNSFHYQTPIGSLGRFLRTSVALFGRQRPYLIPDQQRVAELRARYKIASGDKLLVGIGWKGGSGDLRRKGRSTALTQWGDLLKRQEVQFVSIQYGDVSSEIREAERKFGIKIIHDPEVDPLVDMEASAAQVAAMDIVVSTTNAGVHTAGAIGVPCWTLVPFSSDWRWTNGREDALWYPGMRIFRQSRHGEWGDVFKKLGTEIQILASGNARKIRQAAAGELVWA